MAAYIAFIATLNLCLGYALGVYFGAMPGITPRGGKQEDEEESFGLTLAPTAAAVPAATAETPPPSERPPEVPAATAQTPDDILDGLNAFRNKLTAVTSKLHDEGQDRESLDECADEMKEANHDYLQRTTAVIASLDAEAATESTGGGQELRKLLADQSVEVERANQEIDDILADEDDEAVRQRLLASNEQMADAVAAVEQNLPSEFRSPQQVHADIDDKLSGLLDEISGSLAEDNAAPLQVAAFDVDYGDGEQPHRQRLLSEVVDLVQQELDPDQTAALDQGGRLLIALTGDHESAATSRCERIRQRLAATSFVADGEPLPVVVRCALADTSKAADQEAICARLDETLAEAAKMGDSRTFHHDGTMAAPVTAEPLKLAAETVTLS